MTAISTDDYYGSSDVPRIPALGARGRKINVAEAIIVVGDSDETIANTSDDEAGFDFMIDTQGDMEIFNIEAGSDSDASGEAVWVQSVLSVILTAFSGTVTMTLGDTDDVDGWGVDTAIAPLSSGTGLTAAKQDTADYAYGVAGGKWYLSSSGTIELVTGTADPATAGRMAVYAVYFRCDRAGARI